MPPLVPLLPPTSPPPSPTPPLPPQPVPATLPNGPLTVDLIDHASVWTWLGPALTFSGSVLLFAGAMITIWVTNMRADRRERNKWRRETILKLCSDALGCIVAIEDKYRTAVNVDDQTFSQNMREATTQRGRLNPIAANLRIIGATDLADECDGVHRAVLDMRGPIENMRNAFGRYVGERKKIPANAGDRDERQNQLWEEHTADARRAYEASYSVLQMRQADFTRRAQTTINQTG